MLPTFPNTRDVQDPDSGKWYQECITCGHEGGDCEHTILDEEDDDE